MARRSSRRATLLLMIASLAGPAQAADDAGHRLQTATLAGTVDAETTGALPGSPRALAAVIETETLRKAIAAYRRGALAEGDGLAVSIDDRDARALLEWVAIRAGASILPFARLDAFLTAYPNYPATQLIRRRAEEMLLAEKRPTSVVRRFFHGRAPIGPAGRIALALALQADGHPDEAAALIRQVWLRDALSAGTEARVLAAFDGILDRNDHRLRAERFLFAENTAAALRNAERVSADYLALAKLRLASARSRQPLPAKLLANLPKTVADEPSAAFLKAQQARRAGDLTEAVKALAKVPRDPALLGDGDGWWTERRLIARKLLDAGDAAAAYGVVAGHGAEDTAERIDAEWHAGFVALRFLNDAETASTHFDRAALLAETPISVARAAYWQGRALEARGRDMEAHDAYAAAAAHPVAYYGQLARARLGLPDLPVRRSASAALEQLPGHRGVTLLYAAGARDLAGLMLADLAQRLHTTPALEAVAAIVQRESDARALLTLGKLALQRGFPLDTAAFPTIGIPDFPVLGDPMERAIVHAIARQESAFDPAAQSHAGARGLMQMMPATARETARRANLPFDWERLRRDPLYAARMGTAHLIDLHREWRGSYILMFAAYNAGSGNVRNWIKAYGDPRSPGIDAVDWVERIPFEETRNYVQRVMENLQVYRQRLNQPTAYRIDQDLKRGGKDWPG